MRLQHLVDRRLGAVTVASIALATAACGDSGGDDDAAAADTDGFAAENYTTDLTEVCPETIAVQTGWFPQPERGPLYQLIGAGGTTDPDAGTYSGPLGSTGVELEIRIGGPFVGDQSNTSLLYQDDDITLAEIGTDEGISLHGEFPTVAVVSPLEISPRILMWDPATFEIDELSDIGETGAPVLVFGGEDAWVQYLVGTGDLKADQIDDSYDGSASRFASSQGSVIQQGYVTAEPYEYEEILEEWGEPVDSTLVHDAGYQPYDGAISVRADRLEELSPCLTELVPIMQQAVVDYAADPEEVNDQLIEIADDLASFWSLDEDRNAYAMETMLETGILGNGANDTVGDFDEARVTDLVDKTVPIFSDQQSNFDASVTAEEIVTNEFIDPSIGL